MAAKKPARKAAPRKKPAARKPTPGGDDAGPVLAQLERLGVALKISPEQLTTVFAEAQRTTERKIGRLLERRRVLAPVYEMATHLVVDAVVDASLLPAGRRREMLFGVNRFEHANAESGLLPRLFQEPDRVRWIGTHLFLDETDGSVHLRPSFTEPSQKVADSLQEFLAACRRVERASPESDDYPPME
jgi:hypothetical protein